jgi:hypothetical protein
MNTVKEEAIHAISTLPESATIDDIMYRLYVIDQVRKGVESLDRGDVISHWDLKKEVECSSRTVCQ